MESDGYLEEFEDWASEEMGQTLEYVRIHRIESCAHPTYYANEEINIRFRAWRASRKALVVILPSTEGFSMYEKETARVAIDCCAEAMEEEGITVEAFRCQTKK